MQNTNKCGLSNTEDTQMHVVICISVITGWTADCCLLTPDCSKPTAVAIQVSINVYMKVIEYTCTGVAQSTETLWQT